MFVSSDDIQDLHDEIAKLEEEVKRLQGDKNLFLGCLKHIQNYGDNKPMREWAIQVILDLTTSKTVATYDLKTGEKI